MTEAKFQASVMDLARSPGMLAHHCGDSRLCDGPRGFPDTWVVGRRGLLAAELKMPGRVLSPDQVQWKYSLLAIGIPWRLWTPADLASGRIQDELRDIA